MTACVPSSVNSLARQCRLPPCTGYSVKHSIGWVIHFFILIFFWFCYGCFEILGVILELALLLFQVIQSEFSTHNPVE